MLFGSFFTVYFFDRVVNPDDDPVAAASGFDRPWFIALVNTCILVTSSFTVHWATHVDQARATAPASRRAWCSRSCSA